MAEDSEVKEKKGPSAGGIAKAVIALFSVGIITSACSLIWTTVSELRDKVRELEADKSKWGALTELHNRQIELEIQHEVMRRIFEYEYGRHVPSKEPPKPTTDPTVPKPPPVEQKPLDPDLYRKMQEQRFPNQQKK